MEERCPDVYYCSNGSQPYSDIKPSLLLIPAYASLVTSSLSCLGAVLIVLAYCAFKDLRKGTAQTIITLLALADLGTAVACILGASLFIRYFNLDERSEGECYIFDTVCQIQGSMAMWAYQCSLFWTSILAIHFLLITIFHHSTWTDKLLPLYNIIAWIVPLASTLSLLVLGYVGYNHYVTWTCFLSKNEIPYNYIMDGVWWIPEVLATSLMLFGYTLTLVYIACKQVSTLHTYACSLWHQCNNVGRLQYNKLNCCNISLRLYSWMYVALSTYAKKHPLLQQAFIYKKYQGDITYTYVTKLTGKGGSGACFHNTRSFLVHFRKEHASMTYVYHVVYSYIMHCGCHYLALHSQYPVVNSSLHRKEVFWIPQATYCVYLAT